MVVMTSNLPVIPKIAIVSLVKWMEKHGYSRESWDFYDIDMLDPSDNEIRSYVRGARPTVIGFSATVSTTYAQVKRIAALARAECPDAWIVLGGSLSASANVILNKTAVDVCVEGDGENPWVEFSTTASGSVASGDTRSSRRSRASATSMPIVRCSSPAIPKDRLVDIPFPDYDILKVGLRTRPAEFENYFREGVNRRGFASIRARTSRGGDLALRRSGRPKAASCAAPSASGRPRGTRSKTSTVSRSTWRS
jgi:radical SAM superfamily enzyme YgiQ (UPF0313 family)